MPAFTVDEYQRLVEVVATSVGSDYARARYLVDTASRVIASMANKDPADSVKVLAVCLHTFGATTSPVYSARSNVPPLPEPDPARVEEARQHLATQEPDDDPLEDDAVRAYESSIAEAYEETE